MTAEPTDRWTLRMTLLGIGAMNSPRYRPAGLLLAWPGWTGDHATVRALPVAHTSHPTFGYLIQAAGRRAVWAPEYWQVPDWTAGTDLMFADAAGWDRPIRSPTAPATTPASWTPPSRPATTRSSG